MFITTWVFFFFIGLAIIIVIIVIAEIWEHVDIKVHNSKVQQGKKHEQSCS